MIEKDLEQVVEELPSGWNELKLKQFTQLVQINVNEDNSHLDGMFIGVDNMVQVLAVLTGCSVEHIEELPLNYVVRMMAKIEFITTVPEPKKESIIKWKKIDDVSYNSFVTFMQLQKDPFNNMALLIQAFSDTKLTVEEIDELPMDEIYTGFFFSSETTKKILEQFETQNSKEADETIVDRSGSTYQAEVQEAKLNLQNIYGWHFLAKEIADYTNTTFFEIMDKPALEIVGLTMIMKAKIELNKMSNG